MQDLRTNKHFTHKTNPLLRKDLDEFFACFRPSNRYERKATWSEKKNPTGRWRAYDLGELLARDNASLEVFCLTDEALEASAQLACASSDCCGDRGGLAGGARGA